MLIFIVYLNHLYRKSAVLLSRVSDIEKKLQATESASNFVSKEHMMTLRNAGNFEFQFMFIFILQLLLTN